MADYPYNSLFGKPTDYGGIDLYDPARSRLVQLNVDFIKKEVRAYRPGEDIFLYKKDVISFDNYEMSCYVFEPKNRPIEGNLVYCHGGGLVFPIQKMMMELAEIFAREAGLRVYLPEYRLLPNFRNPYPFQDCLSLLKEIISDHLPYLLYGESIGGTLASDLSYYASKHAMRMPLGELLIYPCCDNRYSRYPSMKEYSNAAWDLNNYLSMWSSYLKEGTLGLDEYLIPMLQNWESKPPKTYLEIAEIDILKDEALAYEKKRKEAGGEVVSRIIPGAYHGFDKDVENEAVKEIVLERVNFLKMMLHEKNTIVESKHHSI